MIIFNINHFSHFIRISENRVYTQYVTYSLKYIIDRIFTYFVEWEWNNEHIKMCFSKTLYFRRIELKLNQEKMAERCCLSPRQYTDLENEKRLPSFRSLINIIIHGGIDLNLFIEEIIKVGYSPEDSVGK